MWAESQLIRAHSKRTAGALRNVVTCVPGIMPGPVAAWLAAFVPSRACGRRAANVSPATRTCLALAVALAAILPLDPTLGGAAEPVPPTTLTVQEILDKVDDLFRGGSSYGRATMIVRTEHWQRTLSLEMWSQGKERSLYRILAPKKEKDTATLKSGKDLWNYLPKVKRVIKLPSSMMSASWMGSHFSNDDLVRDSRMADDYDYEKSFEGIRDDREVVDLTCIPKEDAAVVWGKVVVTAAKPDYLPVSIQYFDEDMALARTLSYGEIRPLGDRLLPSRIEIVQADKPDESTVVIYNELSFDVPIAEDFFSLRTLQQ